MKCLAVTLNVLLVAVLLPNVITAASALRPQGPVNHPALWRTTTTTGPNGWPTAVAFADQGIICVVFNATVAALDVHTGNTRWSATFPGAFENAPPVVGASSSWCIVASWTHVVLYDAATGLIVVTPENNVLDPVSVGTIYPTADPDCFLTNGEFQATAFCVIYDNSSNWGSTPPPPPPPPQVNVTLQTVLMINSVGTVPGTAILYMFTENITAVNIRDGSQINFPTVSQIAAVAPLVQADGWLAVIQLSGAVTMVNLLTQHVVWNTMALAPYINATSYDLIVFQSSSSIYIAKNEMGGENVPICALLSTQTGEVLFLNVSNPFAPSSSSSSSSSSPLSGTDVLWQSFLTHTYASVLGRFVAVATAGGSGGSPESIPTLVALDTATGATLQSFPGVPVLPPAQASAEGTPISTGPVILKIGNEMVMVPNAQGFATFDISSSNDDTFAFGPKTYNLDTPGVVAAYAWSQLGRFVVQTSEGLFGFMTLSQ